MTRRLLQMTDKTAKQFIKIILTMSLLLLCIAGLESLMAGVSLLKVWGDTTTPTDDTCTNFTLLLWGSLIAFYIVTYIALFVYIIDRAFQYANNRKINGRNVLKYTSVQVFLLLFFTGYMLLPLYLNPGAFPDSACGGAKKFFYTTISWAMLITSVVVYLYSIMIMIGGLINVSGDFALSICTNIERKRKRRRWTKWKPYQN